MLQETITSLIGQIGRLNDEEKIGVLNILKIKLHEISPFKNEPVDCVLWIKGDNVVANNYNPNSVAPPEMELLKTSIEQDGYTQPIVAWETQDQYTVVDGFHRNRVGKECEEIKKRILGYLPLAIINKDREDLPDRIASTIRHNRARGKHAVDSMSDIVIELKKRNWSDEKIAKNLGMEQDEITRLTQISGLTEMFKDVDFSKSWDITGEESIDGEDLFISEEGEENNE